MYHIKQRENLMENQASLIDDIRNIPWFHDLTPDQIDRLAKISRIQLFQPEEELFHEGDRVENLYIILNGEVVLENYIPTMGNHVVAHAESLDVIGCAGRSLLPSGTDQAPAQVRADDYDKRGGSDRLM